MTATFTALRGIVLFAHGSRDPLWRLPIEAVAAQISAQQPGSLVRCAYLEICEPDLSAATDELVAAGATTLRVFPLFLGVGKHAREDLPVLVEQLRASHSGVRFSVQTAIGEDPRMTALMAKIACELPAG